MISEPITQHTTFATVTPLRSGRRPGFDAEGAPTKSHLSSPRTAPKNPPTDAVLEQQNCG